MNVHICMYVCMYIIQYPAMTFSSLHLCLYIFLNLLLTLPNETYNATLRAITLHLLAVPNISRRFATLKCTTPPETPLHKLHYTTLHGTALHYMTRHCTNYMFTCADSLRCTHKQHAGHASNSGNDQRCPKLGAKNKGRYQKHRQPSGKLKFAPEAEKSVLDLQS